jgi:hypothetical protein
LKLVNQGQQARIIQTQFLFSLSISIMELICSNCGAVIHPQDINIATDLAKCGTCKTMLRGSELKKLFSLDELLALPPKAKVQMQQHSNGTIELLAPAMLRIRAIDGGILPLLFPLFILTVACLITYWAVAVSKDPWGFGLLTIVLWIPGVLMGIYSLDTIFGYEKVFFNENEISIEVKKFLRTKQSVIDKRDIVNITFTNLRKAGNSRDRFNNRIPSRGNLFVEYPGIVTKESVHLFFYDLPLNEQEWAVRLLKQVLLG